MIEDGSDESNSAKGVDSFDITPGGSLVHFFNRNSTPYPVEVGGPKFDLVPVTKQKDVMLNVARLHARQEYDRIMQLVEVLQAQAAQIKRRLDVTDQVHAAEYQFQVHHGHCYWLAVDTRQEKNILCHLGPTEWSTGAPDHYEYIARVKFLGDHTWIEVDLDDNPIG